MVDLASLAFRAVSAWAGVALAACGGNDAAAACDTFVDASRCPDLSSLQVGPSSAPVGGSVAVTAVVASGRAGEIPALAWSATSGTFANAGSAVTTFTCAEPGAVTVTVMATEDGCSETLTASVTCLGAGDASVD